MKVPIACRELPQVLKRCMNASRKETKKCKKLPSLSLKCQRLSESWQLLAESIKKKVSKDKFYNTTRLKNESTKPKNKSEQTEHEATKKKNVATQIKNNSSVMKKKNESAREEDYDYDYGEYGAEEENEEYEEDHIFKLQSDS